MVKLFTKFKQIRTFFTPPSGVEIEQNCIDSTIEIVLPGFWMEQVISFNIFHNTLGLDNHCVNLSLKTNKGKQKMELKEKTRILGLDINQKLEKSKSIIREAISLFGIESIAIGITGGKDSTTILWIFKQVCEEMGYKLPRCIFIDEGDVFAEIREFIHYIENLWSLKIIFLKNDNVSLQVQNVGDLIQVSFLNEQNQMALEEMNFFEKEFPYIPDSTICNHLMKTIPLRNFIAEYGIKALATAIRWDEATARENEEYFSQRTNPSHFRVHPILHFKERDIWIAIFKYDIPYNSLYRLGYRSLGARCATIKSSDIPAWMQDLENTPERGGRDQEKEAIMGQLRALGYM
jgi:phosphoadenosine phosphosulfate reductase